MQHVQGHVSWNSCFLPIYQGIHVFFAHLSWNSCFFSIYHGIHVFLPIYHGIRVFWSIYHGIHGFCHNISCGFATTELLHGQPCTMQSCYMDTWYSFPPIHGTHFHSLWFLNMIMFWSVAPVRWRNWMLRIIYSVCSVTIGSWNILHYEFIVC